MMENVSDLLHELHTKLVGVMFSEEGDTVYPFGTIRCQAILALMEQLETVRAILDLPPNKQI